MTARRIVATWLGALALMCAAAAACAADPIPHGVSTGLGSGE